ncbi:MAG: tetratricopeptide repeat protein [Magnetococcales bacterium]|nr:tetratricopeptide repeat protein [Magnetococcales bacterium]
MNEKKISQTPVNTQTQITVDEAYNQALNKFYNQCYTESDQLCTAILNTLPNHIDAINLLGVIAQKLNRHDLAVEQFSRAIRIENNRSMLYYNLGISLNELGQVDNALEVLFVALQKDSQNSEIIKYIGNILEKIEGLIENSDVVENINNILQLAIYFHKIDRLDKAENCYKKYIKLNPDSSIALNNYATLINSHGKFNEAISYFKKAITIQPNYSDAYGNLGTVLLEQDELDEAVNILQKAISLKPNYVEAIYSLASAYYKQGMLNEAVINFNKTISLKTDYTDAYINIASIKNAQGKLDEAIISLQKAIVIDANNPVSHNNLGNIYKDQNNIDKAITCYKKAMEVDPEYVLAYNNIGDLIVELGELNEGLNYYKKAIKIQPRLEYEIKLALSQCPIIPSIDNVISYRQKLQSDIADLLTKGKSYADPLEKINITNFYSAYHGFNERSLQKQIANFFLHSFPILSSHPLTISNDKKPNRKLRIGFMSSFMFGHTIGYLNKGIIEHLNRDRFEVVVFRLPNNQDDVSQYIDNLADEAVAITRDLGTTKQIILDKNLDVLYYPDIGMCAFTYFLAFYRLAPVQCTTLGHPITTGIPNMDYFISAHCMEEKEAQQHYSETLYLMQRLPCYYYPATIQDKKPTREDFSLPSDCNIYLCSQTLYKLHPDFDIAIMEILAKDPNGMVVFISGKHENWEKLLRKRWNKLAINRAEQILFLPRLKPDQFISLFQIADVVLDTFHFSGGKTTSEALSVGAPVVTLPGAYMRGRITLGCYKLMGVMDLVAKDAQDYVNIAHRLVNDSKWRKEVVNKIKANSHQIFEDRETVREFERFFEFSIENYRV